MHHLTEQVLQDWLLAARQADPGLVQTATNGHCDAFALALCACLSERFPETVPTLLVVGRTRVPLSDPKDVEETCRLSHVLVEVAGQTIDVNGIDADERWEEDWVQPFENEERGFGESEPLEDLFDYQPVTAAALATLRQQHSQRPVDAAVQAHCMAMLSVAMNQVAPPPARPRRTGSPALRH